MLTEHIWTGFPGFLQSWYTNDFSMEGAGEGANLLPTIEHIEYLGNDHGFYLNYEESQFMRAPGMTEDSKWLETAPMDCSHR